MTHNFFLNRTNTPRVFSRKAEILGKQDGESRPCGELGMGGTNVSAGVIASAMRGGQNWDKNTQIKRAAAANNMDVATTLRSQWGYGDAKAKSQLDSIIRGDTKLSSGKNDGDAQTMLENGSRVVYLNNYKDGMSTADQLALGITLGHEAHRDGLSGPDNYLETRSAVTGHTEMAISMLSDGQGLSMNTNLQNDIGAYMIGQDVFNAYVDGSYDSSGDYWKLKMLSDGSHEIVYDGKKELSIDYINENGEVISTSTPEGQDLSDVGMAGSLAKILGAERAEELLGSSYMNSDNYDNQTLKDVLKLNDNQITQIQRSGSLEGITLSDSQKFSLLGEALMKKSGAVWENGEWQNTSNIAETIVNGLVNGNIMAEVSKGKYLYSTINATVFRDPESWKSYTGVQDADGNLKWTPKDEYTGLDAIVYTKTGLNYDYSDTLLISGYQTIDNMITNSNGENLNQPYYSFGQGWVQGNTVVSSQYNMEYLSSSANFEGNVLIKNNAQTIDGRIVNNEGLTYDSIDRYLSHANRGKGWPRDYLSLQVDGCDSTSYANQQALLRYLGNNWKMSGGYQIYTRLLNGAYNKTPYSYGW